jgi:OmpA family protein
MRRIAEDWGRRTGAITLLASLLVVAPACGAAEFLYGGQINAAGVPVTREGGNDPGGLPGSAPLAAQAGKLDLQRTYGGLRLNDALTVEATQNLPFGDATKSDQQALSLAGKAELPLPHRFSITGKMGVQYSGSNLPPGTAAPAGASGLSPVYGLGLGYETTNGLALRVESERIATHAGPSNTVSGESILIGGRVRF